MAKLVRIFGFAVVSMAVACGTSQAGFFNGSINAHFENPVLSGGVYGGGYHNNSSSARYSMEMGLSQPSTGGRTPAHRAPAL